MIEKLISVEEIKNRVQEIGSQINQDYTNNDDMLILGVLNGAFLFCADLVREIQIPHTIDFLSVSSYGDSTVTSGKVTIEHQPKKTVTGKKQYLQ